MMGSLAYREVVVPWMQPAPSDAMRREFQDIWMGVFFAQERIGYMHSKETPQVVEEDEGPCWNLRPTFL